MRLDEYRQRAEAFSIALNREYYRHYAGLQDDYEIEPIYREHAELFAPGVIEALRAQRDGAPAGSDERRRLRALLQFAVDGFVGEATKDADEELARREAGLTAEIDGQAVGYRELSHRQANEPDGERRAELERRRLALLDQHLGDLHRERTERQHAAAAELGWPSYRALCEDCQELDLEALRGQTAAFLAATDPRYPELLEPQVRAELGLGLADLRRSDLPRLFRAPTQDGEFPAGGLLSSLTGTLAAWGIDPTRQPGLTLDVEPRPRKSPRAFCAPVRTPGEVYLVIAPIGGRDDYAALLHEAGHAQHATHADAGLAFEYRYLGDNAVSETYAFLLQHLLADPVWLGRHLGAADPQRLAAYDRAQTLLYVRRYAGKLAYELELHGGAVGLGAELAERYREHLGRALGIEWTAVSYLADVDEGFYCAAYLRAWALEAQLRTHLRERFGPAWFAEPEAGALVQGLWADGQRRRPEELLADLTGETLSFEPLRAELTAV